MVKDEYQLVHKYNGRDGVVTNNTSLSQLILRPTSGDIKKEFKPAINRNKRNIISENLDEKVEVFIVDDVNEVEGKKPPEDEHRRHNKSDWWEDVTYTTREDDLFVKQIKTKTEVELKEMLDNHQVLGDMINQKRKMVLTKNEMYMLDSLVPKGPKKENRYYYLVRTHADDISRLKQPYSIIQTSSEWGRDNFPAYKTIVDHNPRSKDIYNKRSQVKGYIISPAAEHFIRLKRREAKRFKKDIEEVDDDIARNDYTAGLFYKTMIVKGSESRPIGTRQDDIELMRSDDNYRYQDRQERLYGKRVYGMDFPYKIHKDAAKPDELRAEYPQIDIGGRTFGNLRKFGKAYNYKDKKLSEETSNTQSGASRVPTIGNTRPPEGTIQRGQLGEYYMYSPMKSSSTSSKVSSDKKNPWKKIYFEQIVPTEKAMTRLHTRKVPKSVLKEGKEDEWRFDTTYKSSHGRAHWTPEYIPMNDYHMVYLHRRAMGYGGSEKNVNKYITFDDYDSENYEKKPDVYGSSYHSADKIMEKSIYTRGEWGLGSNTDEWLSEITVGGRAGKARPPSKKTLSNAKSWNQGESEVQWLAPDHHLALIRGGLVGGKGEISEDEKDTLVNLVTGRRYKEYSGKPIPIDYEPENRIVLYNPSGRFGKSEDGGEWHDFFHGGGGYGSDDRLSKAIISKGEYGYDIDVEGHIHQYRDLPTIVQENDASEDGGVIEVPKENKTFEDSHRYSSPEDRPYRPYDKTDIGNAFWRTNEFTPTTLDDWSLRREKKHGPPIITKMSDYDSSGGPVSEPKRIFYAIAAPTMVLTGLEDVFEMTKGPAKVLKLSGAKKPSKTEWKLSTQPIIDRMPAFHKFQGESGTWNTRNLNWVKEKEALTKSHAVGVEEVYKARRRKSKELIF